MVGGLKAKILYGINPDSANTNTSSRAEPHLGGERLLFSAPHALRAVLPVVRSNAMRSLAIGALWTPGYFANRFSGLLFAVLSELRTAMLRTMTARRGIRAGMPTFIPVSDFHRALGDAVRTYSCSVPLTFRTAFPPYFSQQQVAPCSASMKAACPPRFCTSAIA